MGEIQDAVRRYTDRKKAAGVAPQGDTMPEDVSRMLLSGFDLDFEEVIASRRGVIRAALEAMMEHPLPELFFGQWLDGLVTGLVMAQMRREREGAKPDDEVVEEMAIAMCETGQVEWCVQEDHRKDHFRKMAVAALGAMRR